MVPGFYEAHPEHLHPAAGQDSGQDSQEPADLCQHRLVSSVHPAPGALSGVIINIIMKILAPSGAQGVTICVSPYSD